MPRLRANGNASQDRQVYQVIISPADEVIRVSFNPFPPPSPFPSQVIERHEIIIIAVIMNPPSFSVLSFFRSIFLTPCRKEAEAEKLPHFSTFDQSSQVACQIKMWRGAAVLVIALSVAVDHLQVVRGQDVKQQVGAWLTSESAAFRHGTCNVHRLEF